VWVKICGVTEVADAVLAVEAGADAIGVNLVSTSKRVVDIDTARAIVRAVSGRARAIAVIADLEVDQLFALRKSLGVSWLQLHGNEPPATLDRLLPDAFKAIRVGAADDVRSASAYGGETLLLDTKGEGNIGGTGQTFDWSLARELATGRRIVLAGGLTPDNVSRAIAQVSPWGIDVASGVELFGNARRKDPEKLVSFILRAKASAGT